MQYHIIHKFESWQGYTRKGSPIGHRQKIEALPYTEPNEHTGAADGLEWTRAGRSFHESQSEYYKSEEDGSGHARYYYFFPADRFTQGEALRLAGIDSHASSGWRLAPHPLFSNK